MKLRLIVFAFLAFLLSACGTSEGSDATVLLGPPSTTPVDSQPVVVEPALPSPDRQDATAGDSLSVAEPALRPVPVAAPAPTPKPVRGLPTPPPARDVPTSQPLPARPTDQLPATVVDEAVADLALRFGIDPAAIDVLDARRVTWRDGSVGCPEVGLVYTQALVPGSLVVLRIADASFSYHAADGAPVFYCPTPQAPVEGAA